MKKSKLGPEPLILPMPALVVGANVNEKPNFMIASWCGIAAYKPPAITIAMNKARYTLKGIRENGTFSVNVPSCEMVKKADYCGIYSGRKRDKSQIFKTFFGELKTAPLIEECPINLECKALHYLDMRTHILIVGEIIETYIVGVLTISGRRTKPLRGRLSTSTFLGEIIPHFIPSEYFISC
jgi:flavin reductase (DIM6/NTAB) family NADH-FMN oxidoreductase RutF